MRVHTLIVACLSVAGCAEINSIHRSYDAESAPASILSVDAKQRNILIAPALNEKDRAIICAEPNPDFASVLASSLSGSLGIGDKSAQIASALAETGTSIGLRTQSIQLLRDAMYRLCEGYAAGGLTQADFTNLHQRYQSAMIAILAIEQLTGYARPTSIVIGANADASSNDGLAIAQKQLDAAREAQVAADQKLVDAKKADQDAGTAVTAKENDVKQADSAKKPALELELAKLKEKKTATDAALKLAEKSAKEAAENVAAKQDARAKALAITASAQGFGVPIQVVERTPPDVASTQYIATSVVSILNKTLDQDWVRQHCLNIMRPGGSDPSIDQDIRDLCIAYMKMEKQEYNLQAQKDEIRLSELKQEIDKMNTPGFLRPNNSTGE